MALWVHIALENPSAADRALDRIEERCNVLRDYPLSGPARPDIASDARILIIDRWIALYRLIEGGVQIVRLADGAQDLTQLEHVSD